MRSNVKICIVLFFFIGIISQGNCKHISNCTAAQNQMRQRLKPIECSTNGTVAVVCCNKNNNTQEERISEIKCREYLQLDKETTITTTTPKHTISARFVVGGADADYEEFPHMAVLGYGSGGEMEFQCGGSLISDQFVLTAAHCLESKKFVVVSHVRLGDLDLTSDLDATEPQDFNVTETFPHPDYNFRSYYNDIALIKLSRPVIYTRYVKPACLQSNFDLQHNNLTATGWGSLEYAGETHSILQKVKLRSLPMKKCLRTYGPQPGLPKGIDEELQICGGNLQERMDTCQGDSGGPLQLKIQEFPLTHRVVGVTSFGKNCGLVPGVYTRISKYISWIESVVWPKN